MMPSHPLHKRMHNVDTRNYPTMYTVTEVTINLKTICVQRDIRVGPQENLITGEGTIFLVLVNRD